MKLIKIVSLLIIVLFINACKDKKDDLKMIDPAFTNYISGFTAGVISKQSTIKVRLAESNKNAKIGEAAEDDLFDFSPSVKGQSYWIDDRTIEFRPEQQFPSSTIYDVAFDLGEIIEVPSKLASFEFRFQTLRQSIFVNFEEMQAYDENNLKLQKLKGSFQTTDIANINEIEKVLTATQGGKELKISWNFSQENYKHQFVIENVARSKNASEVLLAWNGESIDSEDEGVEKIEIPALGDFKIMKLSVDQMPEQKIAINFSDPLNKNQSLEGLIYSKENDDFRYSREGNSVYLYPRSTIIGDRTIVINKEIKNSLDKTLNSANDIERLITFASLKPEVAFVSKGNILPSSDGFKLPIKAVNLSAVNIKVIKIFEENVGQFLQVNQISGTQELKRVGRIVYKESIQLTADKPINYAVWNTFSLDLSKMIQTEPGAIYRVSLSFDKSQSLYPCSGEKELTENTIENNKEDDWYNTPENYYWDYYDEYDYYYDEDYSYSDRDNPCKDSYYSRGNHKAEVNILASNLGIIAKSGNQNELHVAVTDITTTQPINGVEIEIYNFQNQLMASVPTDAEGIAVIELKYKPFLLVAKRGTERGYLRLDDGSALSLSMFDVSGETNQAGVKGFIYGERGVWRPGDSLYLSFILEDKNKVLPQNYPVVAELYSPDQQLYTRIVRSNGLNGFYDFSTSTSQDAPTGNWELKVKVGNSIFYKAIKIEAIKPNRLKINIDFGNEIITQQNSRANLSAKWLHGADASNLRAMVEMNLSSGFTSFKKYPDYQFDDPSRKFETDEKVVFEGNLDGVGETSFIPDIKVGSNAPGMLKANFKTRVFEKGGDFSIDRFTVSYSPYNSYVGVKIPKGEGWNGALYSNENTLIPIVTVDENGKAVNRENLKIEIYEINWRWWWERGEGDELASYVENESRNLIKTDYVSTINGKVMYQMNFGENLWGRKLIRITDPVSGHSTGATFYLSYKGWWNNSGSNNPGGAEMLTFTTDKEVYTVGDQIKLNLPEISEGRVLVSLESGSKIIKSFWKDASDLKNGISFEAEEGMAPNIYAHLTLIQPHASTANDLPIRMYGIQNISIEAPNTHLLPVLKMPDELQPEQEVKLSVAEKDGKAMTYTIAVVDEGLLDLTRFKTPNPWDYFYRREALGIKTWDMYEYVMGAYSGEFSGLLAIGGDDALNPGEGNKANRFEPVVRFMGPFELKKGAENKHSFNMPNYVGSVRTMVIAGNNGAYGSIEKTTAVKKPLMVLATLPRVVSPSESLKLPVTVFAMDKNITKVEVELEANDLFTIVGESKKTITFNKVGDQIVFFDIKVKEKIGVGKVNVKVSGNGKTASNAIEIGVRLPNPEISKVTSIAIDPGKNWEMDYSPFGINGTNKGVVEVSALPPLNLEQRMKYLIRYPYGCIEQTTSTVFPQLYLSDLLDISNERKDEIQKNVTAALDKFKSFQLTNGAFAYWPGDAEISDWGTNYVGHFMIEAKSKGYALPNTMFKDWLAYQQKAANAWSPISFKDNKNYYYGRSHELNQSYRLYTLALAGKAVMGAMNRMRENKNLTEITKWRLAAAYILAGQKNVAEKIVNSLSTEVEPYKELSYTYGSDTRDKAMILETLILLDQKSKTKGLLDDISAELSSDRWMSTQTTAYSLMAIAKFVKTQGDDKSMNYTLIVNGKSNSIKTEKTIEQTVLPLKSSNKLSIKNNGDKTLFIQLQLSGVPITSEQIDESNNLQMEVRYLSMEGNAIDPSSLNQGVDFMAEVKITNAGGSNRDYKNMALNQLFPSGWEIRNLRMDDGTSTLIKDIPTYQDIRDDRVYTFFDLPRNSSKTFRILLNAAYLGDFYLPAVECSAMYDNTINAVKSGKWIKVVKTGE